jgi:CBS domain-containing protein
MKPSGTISGVLHSKGSEVWTISPTATVFEAIRLLAQRNIGALPVMDGEKLIGIFSERDYTRKVALEGKTSRDTRVREIVSSDVISITSETTVEEAMRLMTENRIRHLPVIENERLVGFISIGDMVNWIISAQNAAIDQMESYLLGR